MKLDHDKHCVITFVSYVQTHDEHDYSLSYFTIGDISVFPTGNEQIDNYYLSLKTGCFTNCSHCTEITITDEAIDRMYHMSRRKYLSGLLFDACNDEAVADGVSNDDSDEDDYEPGSDEDTAAIEDNNYDDKDPTA